MPEPLHQGLTSERWNRFPIDKRLGMIASEFIRARNLAADEDGRDNVEQCYRRAHELVLLTQQGFDQQTDPAVAALIEEIRHVIEKTDIRLVPLTELKAQSQQLEERLSAVQWAIYDGKEVT